MSSEAKDEWAQPKPVDRITMAFPAGIVGTYLPPYDAIPGDFQRERGDAQPWTDLVNRWFGAGLKGDEFTPKEGIDRTVALQHLKTCMGSYDPKHEHKISGVAWLMSRWFDMKSAS
jgi:hypothetical protein